MLRATLTLTVVAVLAGLSLIPTQPAAAAEPTAIAAATCAARILKGSKYVTLERASYKYAFRRIKGSRRFKRVVKAVRVAVRTDCAKRCVVTRKRRGKRRPVYSVKLVTVKVRKGNRIVTRRKRRRVYKFGKCPREAATSGQPITVKVLDGSSATLDFGAFQRKAPVTGSFKGFAPTGIKLGQENQVTLTRGTLAMSPTDVFVDDDCAGQVSSAIRTGRPATISLDPTKTSTSTLSASGTLTAISNTVIRLPLELRNGEDGCSKPYITTGYTEFKKTFFLRGRVAEGGLQKVRLVSPPDTLDVEACLSPGAPQQPCSGFVIPLPIMVSTELLVEIQL